MLDTVVVGGGFWGTACAAKLAEQGREVLLLDSQHPNGASRAAAGIVRLQWYENETIGKLLPDWWNQGLTQIGFEWLERAGLRYTGELFLNRSGKSNSPPKPRKDCYLIPSASAVLDLAPRQLAEVESLVRGVGDWVLQIKGAEAITAKNVVIAAGAFTDQLLAKSGLPTVGVKCLPGRAFVARVEQEFTTPLSVMTRPYTHYTLRPWGSAERSNYVRLGDTVEKTEGNFDKDNELFSRLFNEHTVNPKITDALKGFRPIRDKIMADVIQDGLIVATGGHRVGLCLAGGVAHHVAGLLR